MRRLSGSGAAAAATAEPTGGLERGNRGVPAVRAPPSQISPKMAPGRVSPAAPVVGSGGLDAGLGWARLEPTGGLGSSPAPFRPLTLIGLAGSEPDPNAFCPPTVM